MRKYGIVFIGQCRKKRNWESNRDATERERI